MATPRSLEQITDRAWAGQPGGEDLLYGTRRWVEALCREAYQRAWIDASEKTPEQIALIARKYMEE